MPVTSRPLGEPPAGPPDLRHLLAGLFALLLIGLGVWGMLTPPSAPEPAPEPALGGVPTAAVLATPATESLMPIAAPAAEPLTTAEPTATAVTAPTAAGCPTASPPPPGASVGWIARAAGCPRVALANVSGQRQWVIRDGLSDDIYQQLPEIQP